VEKRASNHHSQLIGGEEGGDTHSPHDLRATFGNRHWKNGTDLAIIAMLMGHESPDQTFKAYIGVSQGDCRKAQDRLGML
jgi:integrase